MRKINVPSVKKTGKKEREREYPSDTPPASALTADRRQDSWQIVKRIVCDNSEKKATIPTHGVCPHWTNLISFSDKASSWHIREIHWTKYTWT